MAYDPNDPADKKIVDKLIADALAEQQETHEADISGLKKKNTDLLKKIKEGGNSPEELTKLENELEAAQTQLREATRNLNKVTKERDGFKLESETEKTNNRNLLVNNSLTEALTTAKVGAHFMDAAKALLRDKVEVKSDASGNPVVMVGDKSLGDFTKEWSQGDQGKHFVLAAGNSGTGAKGATDPTQQSTGPTWTREQYETTVAENPAALGKFFSEGGTIVDSAATT